MPAFRPVHDWIGAHAAAREAQEAKLLFSAALPPNARAARPPARPPDCIALLLRTVSTSDAAPEPSAQELLCAAHRATGGEPPPRIAVLPVRRGRHESTPHDLLAEELCAGADAPPFDQEPRLEPPELDRTPPAVPGPDSAVIQAASAA